MHGKSLPTLPTQRNTAVLPARRWGGGCSNETRCFRDFKSNFLFVCFNLQVNNFPCQLGAGARTLPSPSPSRAVAQQRSGSCWEFSSRCCPDTASLPNSFFVLLFELGQFLSWLRALPAAPDLFQTSMQRFDSSACPPSLPSAAQLGSCLFPKPLCLQVLPYQARRAAMGPGARYFIYFDFYN